MSACESFGMVFDLFFFLVPKKPKKKKLFLDTRATNLEKKRRWNGKGQRILKKERKETKRN
jgi:hypothetical protein